MNDKEKIHHLCNELIPIIDEVDPETKEILLDHMKKCKVCTDSFSTIHDFYEVLSPASPKEEAEIPPLKRLVQFNTGLKIILIAIRSVILFYLVFSSLDFTHGASLTLREINRIDAGMFLFYFPTSIFLTVFTFTFFNKKWSFISLGVDVLLITLTTPILKWILM
ncbi:hypothetical protein FGG79_18945 [Bacillus sp. BHET2]|uniref:hypothetical protein n=1 Tax=Bacillus sp. BHET2 TaxID=2583818 RepID=UPI00110F1E89|nr:hypothetical protein [Bacillus sp. BHET2]TMU83775.1 hypothetical protein FGG79_18945 [Bacillus sp. BHET2]